jgi:hypothetical protein
VARANRRRGGGRISFLEFSHYHPWDSHNAVPLRTPSAGTDRRDWLVVEDGPEAA